MVYSKRFMGQTVAIVTKDELHFNYTTEFDYHAVRRGAPGDASVAIINCVTVKCGRQGWIGQADGRTEGHTQTEADTDKRSLCITMQACMYVCIRKIMLK